MRRVMGIDPGSHFTGFAVLEDNGSDPRLLAFGTIEAPQSEPIPKRLARIYAEISALITRHRPTELAVEEAFFSKNARSALILGEARGIVLLAGAHANLPCHEYAPRKIKMSVVGRGSATKDQVNYMIRARLGMRDHELGFDCSDAIAAALCHLQQARIPG